MFSSIYKSTGKVIYRVAIVSSLLSPAAFLLGQSYETLPTRTPAAATAPTAVPALIPFSGIVETTGAKALTGPATMTFLIYKDEQGGEPLWSESQIVTVDTQQHYSAKLGATLTKGLPEDLFASGEARWLEVQIAGRAPQPRVLLLSVPYALKAADATTLGGLPVSAFALAGNTQIANQAAGQVSGQGITPNATVDVTTTGGASGYLPVFTGAASIVDSTVFQSGSNVGFNTTTPQATLDVNGTHLQRGILAMEATGTATSSAGKNSQPIYFTASAYSSTSKAAVAPIFSFQSEPVSNDTSAPGGTLNLLYGKSATPAETGFYFNSNGTIHFATGQTFAATNAGSIAIDGSSTSGYGVEGTSNSGVGIVASSSSGNGINGTSYSASGVNGYSATGSGLYGTTLGNTLHTAGVYGIAGSANTSSFNGIAGVWGDSSTHAGVYGTSTAASGVYGQSSSSYGVYGSSASAPGVDGFSANSYGLYAQTNSNTAGITAIYGYSAGSTTGVKGASASGNGGEFYAGGTGTVGGIGTLAVGGNVTGNNLGGIGGEFIGGSSSGFNGGNGVITTGGVGYDGGGNGIQATGGSSTTYAGDGGDFYGGSSTTGAAGDGIFVQAGTNPNNSNDNGFAGFFNGNVSITGTISSDLKQFQIDHPTDPANKYLVHASIESSEMVNIYSGNVTTDEFGLATVQLPSWFESLNGDFRYQLTIVGRKAQAWISQEIKDGKFQIASDATNAKISWQVTGVRQDAYAKAHPLVVEQDKAPRERGLYKHPELYGQSADKQIARSHHARPTQPTPPTAISAVKLP
jgi:hypothetical protein